MCIVDTYDEKKPLQEQKWRKVACVSSSNHLGSAQPELLGAKIHDCLCSRCTFCFHQVLHFALLSLLNKPSYLMFRCHSIMLLRLQTRPLHLDEGVGILWGSLGISRGYKVGNLMVSMRGGGRSCFANWVVNKHFRTSFSYQKMRINSMLC